MEGKLELRQVLATCAVALFTLPFLRELLAASWLHGDAGKCIAVVTVAAWLGMLATITTLVSDRG
jgi:hypothetical protein